MLGVASDADCGEKGDEGQRRKHWRSWQMAKAKEGGGGGEKERKGKGKSEASENAMIKLEKKDAKRIPLSEAHFFLNLCTRRLKLSYQHLDKKP